MQKFKYLIICFFFIVIGIGESAIAIPNPWVDCGVDMQCAKDKAGFNFPIKVPNYNIRAMDNMIEITFLFNRVKYVTIRKSLTNDNGDISGDYNIYSVNKKISVHNGVYFDIRGDKDKIYVANMAASGGYYSISCKNGLNTDELFDIYKIIAEAESPKIKF